MAELKAVIDRPSQEDIRLMLEDMLKQELTGTVHYDIGHLSENGWHVSISGTKKDLRKLKKALCREGLDAFFTD